MAVLNFPDALISASARKRFGRPNQYGQIVYGVSMYGEENNYTGIYQTRPSKKGRVQVLERFYVPTNPQSVPQQANRSKFADAIAAWQALSPSQKEFFRLKSYGKRMSGYNVFLHEYLISH